MRGIILAGGTGSRLDPITRVASKQLQPVYDKPMIYYPLATLLDAGITEVLIITTPDDLARFEGLLGDGERWGIRLTYAVQNEPRGIADALVVAASFLGGGPCALILGDNIFHGDFGLSDIVAEFDGGAVIFGYEVADPTSYGVVKLDDTGSAISIEEKPDKPRSGLAVPGLYIYDKHASTIASALEPSERGELEITDVNRAYLDQGELRVHPLGRGVAWLDSGTHDSLLDAANYIATIESRQGSKVACLEEIAYRRGCISRDHLAGQIQSMPLSAYRAYLERVVDQPQL